MRVTGVMFYYYHVCERKMWFFSRDITLEEGYENVEIGKIIDNTTYKRSRKHIQIDETINIDFLKEWEVIHEIKKSASIEEASIMQVKYYIYYLNNKGIKISKGILDYPLIRQRREITIDEQDIKNIEDTIIAIQEIIEKPFPPSRISSKICKKCAYYDMCYI